jgi:hypothetical protein
MRWLVKLTVNFLYIDCLIYTYITFDKVHMFMMSKLQSIVPIFYFLVFVLKKIHI